MSLSDLIGKKIHRLMVLSEEPPRNGRRYFKCRCDCGNTKITRGDCLNNGSCKSCGCLRKGEKTHGFSGTRFYRIWKGMKNRCCNKNDLTTYPGYGGRGICVTERWHKFENFKDDMYESYLLNSKKVGEKNISIDRIDNDGNYRPGNCRWATMKMQSNNKGVKKLSRNDVKAIRQEYHCGNGRELAKKYDVSPAAISKVVNYKGSYARRN